MARNLIGERLWLDFWVLAALKHLTLRNRIVSTSHAPDLRRGRVAEGPLPVYHREKARGGVALTMIGGSAVVSPDSPPSFGNLLLYKDEAVRWLRRLADDVHVAGAAVMCQITHLGRRTSNFSGEWLPVVFPHHCASRRTAPSPRRRKRGIWIGSCVIARPPRRYTRRHARR